MAVGLLMAGCTSVLAFPTLQLDIAGGTYMGGSEESTIANSDSFDLYALLLPKGASTLDGLYRISAAVYPKVAQEKPAPSLGTFTFAGETIDMARDPEVRWGAPPEELLAGTTSVGTDLPDHGIFSTYFIEFDVKFNSANQLAPYNVQDTVGDPAGFPGSGLYYQEFAVNVSGMDEGYGIHFDLYQVESVIHSSSRGNGKKAVTASYFTTDMIEKAPFSHDAASGMNRDLNPNPAVPDQGSTLSLMGLALMAVAGLRAKFGRS